MILEIAVWLMFGFIFSFMLESVLEKKFSKEMRIICTLGGVITIFIYIVIHIAKDGTTGL